jgi:hypothetical protein
MKGIGTYTKTMNRDLSVGSRLGCGAGLDIFKCFCAGY